VLLVVSAVQWALWYLWVPAVGDFQPAFLPYGLAASACVVVNAKLMTNLLPDDEGVLARYVKLIGWTAFVLAMGSLFPFVVSPRFLVSSFAEWAAVGLIGLCIYSIMPHLATVKLDPRPAPSIRDLN
jgi:hypothetical protein